jgi:hypothetical protein
MSQTVVITLKVDWNAGQGHASALRLALRIRAFLL